MVIALIWCLYLRATRSAEVRAAAAYASASVEGDAGEAEFAAGSEAHVALDRF
jgi:hypothetical protein